MTATEEQLIPYRSEMSVLPPFAVQRASLMRGRSYTGLCLQGKGLGCSKELRWSGNVVVSRFFSKTYDIPSRR